MNHYTYFLRAEDISLWRAILQYARRMLHARARYHQCLEYLHGCILEPLASQTCMPELHLLQEVLPPLSAGAAEKIAKNPWNSLVDDGYRFIGQLERPLHHGCIPFRHTTSGRHGVSEKACSARRKPSDRAPSITEIQALTSWQLTRGYRSADAAVQKRQREGLPAHPIPHRRARERL